MTVAVTNAAANERDAETMYPVTIGAEIAAIWPQRFTAPASVPTLSRGDIREGTVHATGAAAASPPKARLIQISAPPAVWALAAPKIARPKAIPVTITVWRTRFAL